MSGKYSNFEKDFNLRFSSVENRIKTIESKISTVMTKSLQSTNMTNAYWNGVRKELDVLYKELVIIFDKWSMKEIPARYRRSLVEMRNQIISKKGIYNKAKLTVNEMLKTNYSKAVSKILWQDAANSMLNAAATGKRNMYRLTRMTQQFLIEESFIDIEIAKAIEAGNLEIATRRIRNKLYGQLVKAVKEERFVQAGSRKYRATYYARMVARTKFHEAHTQATFGTAKNYGTDLVIVSSHNTATELCSHFEGKVYSISGADKRFPQLQEVPPFHPNCLHLLFPQFVSGMEVQGTLDGFSEFSKGQINKPPVPAGFIPVDNRGIA